MRLFCSFILQGPLCKTDTFGVGMGFFPHFEHIQIGILSWPAARKVRNTPRSLVSQHSPAPVIHQYQSIICVFYRTEHTHINTSRVMTALNIASPAKLIVSCLLYMRFFFLFLVCTVTLVTSSTRTVSHLSYTGVFLSDTKKHCEQLATTEANKTSQVLFLELLKHPASLDLPSFSSDGAKSSEHLLTALGSAGLSSCWLEEI